MVKTFKYRGETFAWYDTTTGCTDEIPSPAMLESSDRFGDGPLQFCDYLLATSPDWEKSAKWKPLDLDDIVKYIASKGAGVACIDINITAEEPRMTTVYLKIHTFDGVAGWRNWK